MESMKSILILISLAGCVDPSITTRAIHQTERLLLETEHNQGQACSPIAYATAQVSLEHARKEITRGHIDTASSLLKRAHGYASQAAAESQNCGSADADNDGVVDVLDQCPEEREDHDGDQDEDGCRDFSPYDDDDDDGIYNIDDSCPMTPEDFDEINDEDGCPESDEDTDGDGFIDALDLCPEEAEDVDRFEDDDGCPELDNDMDGVPDTEDQCSRIPEDTDGFEDEDGCPEVDNDMDGVIDTNDKCPYRAGDVEDDGCPTDDKKLVFVTTTSVTFSEPLQFSNSSATLLPSAQPALDELFGLLKDNPSIHILILGHTDNTLDDEASFQLSHDKAEAIRVYLASKGLDSRQVESRGLGATKPIDTNRTSSGRERNNRIEIVVGQ